MPTSVPAPASVDGPPSVIRPYMPELDCIRGIAVLMVVFYHGLCWGVPLAGRDAMTSAVMTATRPGWLGVQLFFVLSGFLITGILLDQKESRRYFARFYSRRARRILPPYVVLLACLLITGVIDARFAIASLLFLSNVVTLFGIGMGYGPLWSLAVEEHFYLVWPAVVRLISRAALVITVCVIVLAEPVVRLAAFRWGYTGGLFSYTWFNLDGLAIGAFIAVVARCHSRRFFQRMGIVFACAGIVIGVVGFPFGIVTRTRAVGAALQVEPAYMFSAALLIFALLWGSRRRELPPPLVPLRFFGHISYGLYLVHLAVFIAFDRFFTTAHGRSGAFPEVTRRFLICLLVSTSIATISRETLEKFFLKQRRPAPGLAPEPAGQPS